MAKSNRKAWRTITREERYFTALLYHDVRSDPDRLLNLVRGPMDLARRATVMEVGYEVCFFRDAYHCHLIKQQKDLEKQTFDLVLFLDSDEMVIIEAKAQQGFKMKQIEALIDARSKIEQSGYHPATRVSIAALFSSRYSPRARTRDHFHACITWRQIAETYPLSKFHQDYQRADDSYRDHDPC